MGPAFTCTVPRNSQPGNQSVWGFLFPRSSSCVALSTGVRHNDFSGDEYELQPR